jgi:hypothetical protein
MKGKSLCQFPHFISSRFGNVYPNEAIILYLKQDIRDTHIRHEFKVENGLLDIGTISPNDLKEPDSLQVCTCLRIGWL